MSRLYLIKVLVEVR